MERQFEEALLELGWEKIPNWECMFVRRKQGLFLSVTVDDFKMAGKKQETAPTWKKFFKTWILTKPHHFLTLCTWCTLSGNANRMKQSLNSTQRCIDASWWAQAMECYFYIQNVQDLLADGQTLFCTSVQFTIGWAGYSIWSTSQILCNIIKKRSSASVRHKSPSWKIHCIRLERGEKLDWWSFWLRIRSICKQIHHLKQM